MGKIRTITLTGRPPVKIDEDVWDVLASASDEAHDGQVRCQANRVSSWSLTVRQHDTDGRVLVYAVYGYTSNWERERSLSARRGVLLTPEGTPNLEEDTTAVSMERIVAAITEVAADIAECEHKDEDAARWQTVRDDCIADLPAEAL